MNKKTKNTKDNNLTFNDSDVEVLDPLEGIRKRYDMYIGSDEPVFHMIKEFIDNSIDEFMNKEATYILVQIDTKENQIIVKDDGRGMPLGINKKTNKPNLETLFTYVHAGSKFNKKSVKASGGKNGIGIKCCTACCENLYVESRREGKIGSIEFSKGKVIKEFELENLPKKEKNEHGLTCYFIPDETLFGKETSKIDVEKVRELLKLKCYLNAGLTVYFIVDDKDEEFCYEYGLSDFLNTKIKNPLFNMENILIKDYDKNENTYEIALSYEAKSLEENISSFVNSLPTLRGKHETGFKRGLTQAFTKYISENGLLTNKEKGLEIKGEDIRRGLVCIISLKHENPMYNSQVKDELTNKEIDGIMSKITSEGILDWLNKNPKTAKDICKRIITFAKESLKTKKELDKIVRVSSSNSGLQLCDKFKDCMIDDPDKVEIYIIEGDSAGSTCVDARFVEFQCIFALRGKILNTYGSSPSVILNNKELNNFLIVEFGTNDFKVIKENLNKLKNGEPAYIRSKKIVILTDSDSDGYHIAILFLCFIYEHFPEMFELGYFYIAKSPFYRVQVNGKWQYFMNNEEYSEFIASVISKSITSTVNKNSISKIMKKYEKYINEFRRIRDKFSIHEDILNSLTQIEEDEEFDDYIDYLNSLFKYDKEKDNFVGLYKDIWHNFSVEELFNECNELMEIYPFSFITYIDKTDNNEEKSDYIYNALEYFMSFFKYKRNRLKGLGELDDDELRMTTFDPENRIFIKAIKDLENFEEEKEMFKSLFSPNADRRKNFINEKIL